MRGGTPIDIADVPFAFRVPCKHHEVLRQYL
jgi:hypothetical protein